MLAWLVFAAARTATANMAQCTPPADFKCDKGSLKGDATCTVTSQVSLPCGAVVCFHGSMLILGKFPANKYPHGQITADGAANCTVVFRGVGPRSVLTMRGNSSITAPIVHVEAQAVIMWNASYINATATSWDQQDNHTATLSIHLLSSVAVRPQENCTDVVQRDVECNVSLALYNETSIVAARVNISAPGRMWIDVDAQINAANKISQGFPVLTDGGYGGGYGGYGADCKTGVGRKHQPTQEPYGVIFGGAEHCLDGNPGAGNQWGMDAGFGGGQILLHTSRLVLNGRINASGGAGIMDPSQDGYG